MSGTLRELLTPGLVGSATGHRLGATSGDYCDFSIRFSVRVRVRLSTITLTRGKGEGGGGVNLHYNLIMHAA